MKSTYKKIMWAMTSICLLINFACTNLDETLYSQLDNENFLQTEEEISSALAAMYSGLRTFQKNDHLWTIYCTTDEVAIVGRTGGDWAGDGQDQDMTEHTWTTDNRLFKGTWEAFFAQVNTCNRLIYQLEQIDPLKYAASISEIKTVRALWYLWLIDMWGNVPIVDKFDVPKNYLPSTNTRQEVFNFIEREIKENLPNLTKEKSNSTYGRADYWTAYAILAKLYLNAGIYTGTPNWQNALAACDTIINSGKFQLTSTYRENFVSKNEGSPEAIFAIPFDGTYVEWGWILPLVSLHYASQATFNLTNGPWNGLSVQTEFFNLYEDNDIRKSDNFLWGPQYSSTGQPIKDDGWERQGADPNDPTYYDPDGENINFTPTFNSLRKTIRQSGVRIKKWEIETGGNGFLSSDFFVFRYSDILLMKAEVLWRQSPGSAEALVIVNQFRTRAGINGFSSLTEQRLLEERGRELFMESWRRSDMIRFGKFNDPTIFKPNTSDTYRRLYPVPKEQRDANPNLDQNPGYIN
jgi:hypothetical protein